MSLGESPKYFDKILDVFTSKKEASRLPADAAASKVFPVPGGPKRRMPFQGFMESGFLSPAMTAVSIKSCFTLSMPPMSENFTVDLVIRDSIVD